MKLFIDTALPEHVEKYYDMGLIEGVTTNPKIFVKSGGRYQDYLATVEELCSFGPIPVSVELTGVHKYPIDYLVAEAEELSEIDHNINIKVPLFVNKYGTGLEVMRLLHDIDVTVNATCLMSAYQGILCAKMGAEYISLFYRRMCDTSTQSETIREFTMLKEFLKQQVGDKEIIAGSIRAPEDVTECFHAGADIVTVTPEILEKMITHERTESTIEEFEEEWEKFRTGRTGG